jgi:putative salt-induced outer membrane protein YdiY
LDYRGTFSAGVGYRIIQDDKHRLVLRGGPGFTEEIYHSPILMRATPDMFGEVEMNWPVLRRMQFEQKTTFSPSVQNFAMLRMINQTGLLLPLDERKRWNLRIGFRYEFNGRPNVNRLPSDYTTQFNIVYARP